MFLLVRLYPFVYFETQGSYAMFYHCEKNKYLATCFDGNVNVANKSAFTIESTSNNNLFLEELIKEGFGIVTETDCVHREMVFDFNSELEQYYKDIFSDKIDCSLIDVFTTSITITLDDNINVFTGNFERILVQNLDQTTLSNGLIDYISTFKNVNTICIYMSGRSIKHGLALMNFFKKTRNNIYPSIPFADYKDNMHEIERIWSGKACVMLKRMDVEQNAKFIKDIIIGEKKHEIKYIVNNPQDIACLEQFDLMGKNNVSFSFVDEGTELDGLLGYAENDIFLQVRNTTQLIRNEWFNNLYWGSLYVDSKGNILGGPNLYLGNILNMNEVSYDKLFGKDSLWVITRKQFPYCKDCGFRNICGPLSLIEISGKRCFCKLNTAKNLKHLYNI